MPGSSTSLDSLSSPSPSPSPPPDATTKANEPPNSAGLDGDSELSELTDDEQDDKPQSPSSKRGRNNSVSRRGGSSRRGRTKGSSLVPPAMWGWAAVAKADSAAEEEEDELAGDMPRPTEEEEEGDDDGADAKQPLESIVADDELDHSRSIPPPSAQSLANNTTASSMAQSVVDMQPAMDLVDLALAMAQQDASNKASDPSPPKTDGSSNDMLNSDDDVSDVEPSADADENENETESEDEQPKEEEEEDEEEDDAKAAMDDDVDDEEVDVTAPSHDAVAPIVAAASASSIMAGSALVAPASPSSTATSRSPTPASSRSPSPAPPPKTPATMPKSLLAPATVPDPPADNEEEEEEDDEVDELAQEEIAPPPKRKGKARGKQKPDMRIDVEVEREQDMDVDGDLEQDDDMGAELESDLQPAHRAEALDVLASIEFKFGRLRETLYVERMEQLAWEESLILDGTHPEFLHYQKELSSRRDKRIDLATRKRELEITAIVKKRRVNEACVWSWWKHERDQLQTDLIADNNRKKRKLERERRTLERPQQVRRIPLPPMEVPPAPSLKQIADSFPFPDFPNKRRRLDAPSSFQYPELSTLSSSEVASDLEFLYSFRRPPPFDHRIQLNPHPTGPSGPSLYDAYSADNFPPRERMQPPSTYSLHGPPQPQPPIPLPPSVPSPVTAFPGFGTNPSRNHHHHHPGPGSNTPSMHNPPGNSIHGPSPFASMDTDLPGHGHFGPTPQPPPPPPPSGFHGPGSSRRSSMSPAPNGFAGKGSSQWMGPGMGMPMFSLGGGVSSKGPPPNDWMGDPRHEEELIRRERERERERERDRDREKVYDRREREREHARELEREHREREHREREHRERDRDREREREREGYLMQQQQQMMHRHSTHSHGALPPHHHHHRPHHHHVVHHHHANVSGPSSAGPSAPREYDRPNSRSNAEMINLPAPKAWKGDDGPPRRPPMGMDERDRPAAVPFAMGPAPPTRTHSPRAPWSADGYRSPGHRYAGPPPPLSSSSRAPLPNPLTLSPQTRTLPPPTSPSRYRDDVKKMLPLSAGPDKSGLRMVNDMRERERERDREKDRMLASPPPRMGIPPRVPQLVDGS